MKHALATVVAGLLVAGCHAPVHDQLMVRSTPAPDAATVVSGTVRDGGGRPLDGVIVVVRGPEVRTATDGAGRFRAALPEGLWQLAAVSGGAEHALGTLPFTAGTETTLAITLGDGAPAARSPGPPFVDTSTNMIGLTIQQRR